MDNACPHAADGQNHSTKPSTAINHPGLRPPCHCTNGWFMGGTDMGASSNCRLDCELGREWHGRPARGSEKSPDMGKMPMPHRTTDNSKMRLTDMAEIGFDGR
jgi:hypothetical protein